MRKILSIAAGVAAIALGSLLVASPASAATLPVGQKLTTVLQFDEDVLFTQMFNTSPADASSTAIAPIGGPFFVAGIDVNDDGLGYALQVRLPTPNDPPVNSPWLWVANANTGVFSGGVQIVPTVDITITACEGIDLSPSGEILIACYNYQNTDFAQNSYIGTVTPAGAFTPFVSSGVNANPVVAWDALTINPISGTIYAFGSFQGNAGVYVINRAAGTSGLGIETDPVLSADYDRNGQLFVLTAEEGGPYLATFDPSVPEELEDIGAITVGGDTETARALTIWGKILPATGPAEILPIGLGTALLFLAGAAFIATSRIQRREV